MDEERLLRIEESLDVYDRTTNPYPPAPDGRWPLSVTARALLAEVRRLHAIVDELEPAASEAVRFRQLLVEYGRHSEGCSAAHGDQYRCRCGWREVERELISPAER